MAEFRLMLPDGKGILGSLDEIGVLTFVIQAGPGTAIRGTEMFDLMMRAFGSGVQCILGVWRRGFQESPSVNLDKMNELTASDVSLGEAVTKTWTATRAGRWGFDRITVIQQDGSVGAFSKLDVLFERGATT